jgi:hypothetical protein
VGVRERLGDRQRVGRRLGGLERQTTEGRLGEVAAVDVLHHQERLLTGVDVVVDADDVVVRQRGERPRLAVEPLPQLGVTRDEGAQRLDRNIALERAVAGAPDDTHAPLAHLLEQRVSTRQDGHGAVNSTAAPSVRRVLRRRETAMGRIVISGHVSLDGVMQDPTAGRRGRS